MSEKQVGLEVMEVGFVLVNICHNQPAQWQGWGRHILQLNDLLLVDGAEATFNCPIRSPNSTWNRSPHTGCLHRFWPTLRSKFLNHILLQLHNLDVLVGTNWELVQNRIREGNIAIGEGQDGQCGRRFRFSRALSRWGLATFIPSIVYHGSNLTNDIRLICPKHAKVCNFRSSLLNQPLNGSLAKLGVPSMRWADKLTRLK